MASSKMAPSVQEGLPMATEEEVPEVIINNTLTHSKTVAG